MSHDCHMCWSKGHITPFAIFTDQQGLGVSQIWLDVDVMRPNMEQTIESDVSAKVQGSGFEMLTKHIVDVYITAWEAVESPHL